MTCIFRARSAAILTAAVFFSVVRVPVQADDTSPQSTSASVLLEEGRLAYEQMCARCHGNALQGQVHAPPLTGEAFRATWQGETARALYGQILSTMPLESPGSLLEQDVVSVTLYCLSKNGVTLPSSLLKGPAGLNDIKIEFAGPGGQ